MVGWSGDGVGLNSNKKSSKHQHYAIKKNMGVKHGQHMIFNKPIDIKLLIGMRLWKLRKRKFHKRSFQMRNCFFFFVNFEAKKVSSQTMSK